MLMSMITYKKKRNGGEIPANAYLVDARNNLGLTVKEAAAKMKVNPLTLYHAEGLKSIPSLDTQKKICRFYSRNGYSLSPKDVFDNSFSTLDRLDRSRQKAFEDRIIPFSQMGGNPSSSYSIDDKIDVFLGNLNVKEAMGGIGERNKRVLYKYAEGYTLSEIGKEESISRERVRQILSKTSRDIRKNIYNQVAKSNRYFNGC